MTDVDRPRASAHNRLAAERAAAARARLAAAQRRRRMLLVGGPVLAVLLVVAVLVAVKVATGAAGPKSGQTATTASQRVIADVTSVPASVLNAVGIGAVTANPKRISGTVPTQGGQPRVLYVGAEYCPFCAVERWAVVVALSRFGTFSNLGQSASSPSDVFPSTPTLTFHGAGFTGKYVAFTGKELQSNEVVNGKYAPLDTLNSADQARYATLNPGGSIPFLDIDGKYAIAGASYDPKVLQGKTHAQIAAALSDAKSDIAQGADGAANAITAAICESTGNQPVSVCAASGVKAAATRLGDG